MGRAGRQLETSLKDRCWPWFALAVLLGFAGGRVERKPSLAAPASSYRPATAATSKEAGRSLPEASPRRPAVGRTALAPGPEERALSTLAQQLKAPGGSLENPCVRRDEVRCAGTALDPFFDSLDELAAGRASGSTVIATIGNSLIAGDRIVDEVRDRFRRRFGSAGRGLLLVDRFLPIGPRARCGYSEGGWRARTLADFAPLEHPVGLAGVYYVAEKAGARSRFKLDGERHGTLWWRDVRDGGQLSVRAGTRILSQPERLGDGRARETRFDIPADASALEVVAEGKGAVAFNLVLDHDRSGVVLDNAGVPAADANLFLRADEGVFRQQLAARAPRLSMFILGGNETKRLQWRRTDLESVESGLRGLLRRARAAAPHGACLVVGPIDAVVGKGPDPMVERPWLREVIALERRAALSEGCAFFDLYAAMGGAGSLRRFQKAGLLFEDLVHPRGRGLDLLGHLLADALMRAWIEAPRPDALGGAVAWEQASSASELALCSPRREEL